MSDATGGTRDGSDEDDKFFDYGDLVYLAINPAITGMVIGESDFGRRYTIRLAATLGTMELHWFELERIPENEPEDNVIDFTKARDLRTAKAQGAA